MKTLNLLILLTFIFILQIFSNHSLGQSPIQDTVNSRLERARQMERYNVEATLNLMQNTLSFAIQQKDKRSEWEARYNIGLYHIRRNQIDEATQVFQNTIRLAQKMDSTRLEGLGFLRLSVVYMRLKRLEAAKTNATKARDIFIDFNDKSNQAKALSNLGGINTMLGLNQEGLNNFMTAYSIADELGQEDLRSTMSLNISYYYLSNGQGEAAIPYITRGLDYQLKQNHPSNIARSYGNLAYAYSLTGDFRQAFENYQHCIDTAQKYNFTQIEYETYKDMSDTYAKSGNLTKAMEYQTKHYTLRDSVIDKETQNRVSELEIQYETAEQEREIDVLQQQKQIKNLQLVLLAIGLGVLGLIGWMIIQRQRNDIRRKQDLIAKNDKIHRLEKELIEKELQQKILQQEKSEAEAKVLKQQEAEARHYAKALEVSNKELEQFAHVVSHDLREPIRMVKSYMGLIKRAVDKETLERTGEFFHYAIDGAERMDKMVLGILNIAKVQQQELDLQPLSLNQTVETATQNLHEFIEEKNAKVIYEDLPTIQGDNLQIVQLVQNLINNGLKYNTSDTPTVWIEHKVINNQIELSFKDNGIGIADEYQERVFQMFQRLENHRFSGTGIGLATCKKIVERHHGTIDLASKKGEGTTFFVRLPSS